MRPLKLLLIAFSLSVMTSAFAASYTLNRATKAAGKLMPKDGPAEFLLFNLPEPKAKPQDLLKYLRQAKENNAVLTIASPKVIYIRDLLTDTMKIAEKEEFKGLYLIIIAEKIDAPAFAKIMEGRGVNIKYGVF